MDKKKCAPIDESKCDPYVRQLRLMDEDFMVAVFENQPLLVQLLVRTILNKQDLVVERVEAQRENNQGQSVQLNAFASDTAGKLYDIKIQCARKEDLREKILMLDINSLETSDRFAQMPDEYAIFILEHDDAMFPNGEAIRMICRRYSDTNELFEDGTYIVLVNGAYQNDGTDIGKLMHDFRCANADDMLNESLANRVRFIKQKAK